MRKTVFTVFIISVLGLSSCVGMTTPSDSNSDLTQSFVNKEKLNDLTNMSIMPNLIDKINDSLEQNKLDYNSQSFSSNISKKASLIPFNNETTKYFNRSWLYMMINEDIPLLQGLANNAKNYLESITNDVSEQFRQSNLEIEYDIFYALLGTSHYVKFSPIIDYPDGLSLTFIDASESIAPGQYYYIEFQYFLDQDLFVSRVSFSFVAPYNTDHYISIHIENRGDDYIQIHDTTKYKDSYGNDVIAGRNFEFTFNENDFYIWKVDHSAFLPDPLTPENQEFNLSFQFYEKNIQNQVIDYNSSHFITFINDYYRPEEYITYMPLYDEVYISPNSMNNLNSYVVNKQPADYQISQITLGDTIVEGLLGDAFDLNDGTNRLVVDINNRYMELNPEDFIQYLIDQGADFKFDVKERLKQLIDINQSYVNKSAFGFQPLLSNYQEVYNYFIENYYIDDLFIQTLINSIKIVIE